MPLFIPPTFQNTGKPADFRVFNWHAHCFVDRQRVLFWGPCRSTSTPHSGSSRPWPCAPGAGDLAANIANADTPNYKARDIDFRALLGGAQAQQATARLVATNAAHLPDAEAAGNLGGALMYRMPLQPSIDGNTVDPQAEYAQFAQNALQYQSSLTFLSGRIRTLLTAIRGD